MGLTYLPLWSTGFYCDRGDGTGAGGSLMSLVRFATAEALFETFPELSQKISAKPSQQFPMEFLKTLVATGKIEDAVTFCPFLLPRREAVWWACRSARAPSGHIAEDRATALL